MAELDLLQIKIDKAKAALPEATRDAIQAVDWRGIVLSMREKKGFSFEQIEDLGVETELLLCGLLSPENFPAELSARMKIPRAKADELVNEMNELVFKKIRQELMKLTEKKKIQVREEPIPSVRPAAATIPRPDLKTAETDVLKSVGINITPSPVLPPQISAAAPMEKREDMLTKVEHPETISTPKQNEKILSSVSSIPISKLSGSFQLPTVKTEYSLSNISKTPVSVSPQAPAVAPVPAPQIDPYREIPQ